MKKLQTYSRIVAIWFTLVLTLTVVSVSSTFAFEWNVTQFNNATGLRTSPESIRQTWRVLLQMKTTDYLGGQFVDVSLTQSAMIAGAIALGGIEFDNLLRTGEIPDAYKISMNTLLNVMKSATGIDLAGVIETSSLSPAVNLAPTPTRTGSVIPQSENISGSSCSPYAQTALNEQGKQYVAEMTNASITKGTGFSTIKTKTGNNYTGGFASLGCLDRLFFNFSITPFFNPPNYSSLTSSLADWNCEAALDLISQFTNGQSDQIFNDFLAPLNLKTVNSSRNTIRDQHSTFQFLTDQPHHDLELSRPLESLF